MSAGTWLAVAGLGGIGAVARFAVDLAVIRRAGEAFPVGILVVNLTGAFALGVLAGSGPSTTAMRLAGTATLGAYTTFSTWMLHSRRLHEDGRRGAAIANLAVSLVLGLLAAWAGRGLGRTF
jgi:CrcB protein